MNITRIISTVDPINGFNILELRNRPHLVEGDSRNPLTIDLETEATRQAYLDIPLKHPE